jgi:trans-aconitate 2-methyltransferase
MTDKPRWDPALYERYKAYRDRPALDLLLQVPPSLSPRVIWDLGCGTGEIAAVLAGRHPEAVVHGLDSSPEMLAQARSRQARVQWALGDIADFNPDPKADLVFTNAALQWLPDHDELFPRIMEGLAPGGVLACQMPDDEGAAHRRVIEEVAARGPWATRLLGKVGKRSMGAPQDYHRWLAPLSDQIDIWRTVYLHELVGGHPVTEWVSGTYLRPYLEAFGDDEAARTAFLGELNAAFETAFPRQPNGSVLFPFPRLFIVARRRAGPRRG